MGSLVGFFPFCCVCCFLVHWKALLFIKTSGFGLFAFGLYLPLSEFPLAPEKRVLWLEFFDVLVRKYTLLSIFGLGSSLTGSCFPYHDLIFVCYTKVAGSCFPYNFNFLLI